MGGGKNPYTGQLLTDDRGHSRGLESGSRLTTFSSVMKCNTGPQTYNDFGHDLRTSIGLRWLRIGQVTYCCEYGNTSCVP